MKVRVASAGTGKTTSLVLRYLELIAGGTPVRRCAGVTFTRTAAEELRQRVEAAVRELLDSGSFLDGAFTLDEDARPAFEEALRELGGATLSTIHGFMIAALRLNAPTMGLDPDFRLLGEWEAEAIFEEEVRSLLYLAAEPQHGLHGAVQALGDDAEALLLQLFEQRSLSRRLETDEHPRNRALQALFEATYKRFELRLGARLLPPSEVERRALRLIETPKAVARLAARYPLILVDEYQDVNPLQGLFFEALEQGGIAVEVVGDPKQSIYGFRNADVEVFRRALRHGEVLPPLRQTRRHATVLTRFLNSLTGSLAAAGRGFGPQEAPPVETAGPQREVRGRVELHWVTGNRGIGELRRTEAAVLAERLRELHQQHGIPYRDMAVLARSYAGLTQVEEALAAAELPYVFLQGRGYFERLEIRDLYHALRVGIDPSGLSLGAWLRSPFAQLPLEAVAAVLAADDPLALLRAEHPKVHERLELLRESVRATPLAALKFLIREPFLDGRRYVDFLAVRARENVDALLFTVAQQPPGDIEILLDRLDLLSRQTDAGDVPQSGDGIQLLTVHRSKGLEWPLVAVFDLGRMPHHRAQPLYLEPGSGRFAVAGTPGFEAARAAVKAREQEESFRLLYVAASRAREVLVLTGSIKNGKPMGWAEAFTEMKLGPEAAPFERPDFVLQAHPLRPAAALARASRDAGEAATLQPAPWIDRRFPRHEYPPVYSPSRLKGEDYGEPLPFADPEEGERLPGRATTVGTLVHYAISQNWRADDPRHLDNLRAQEVMFPYTPAEQDDMLAEVKLLLGNYQSLLGRELPALAARSEDHSELPMALPAGATVWQGIIDRLYGANGRWFLEDYKTDHEIVPERYHFQLAVYLRAVQAVRGVTPQVQLVYLRAKQVVVVPPAALEEALAGISLPEAMRSG